MRVLPHWPDSRYLELATNNWARTRAKLLPSELDAPFGAFTRSPSRQRDPGRSARTVRCGLKDGIRESLTKQLAPPSPVPGRCLVVPRVPYRCLVVPRVPYRCRVVPRSVQVVARSATRRFPQTTCSGFPQTTRLCSHHPSGVTRPGPSMGRHGLKGGVRGSRTQLGTFAPSPICPHLPRTSSTGGRFAARHSSTTATLPPRCACRRPESSAWAPAWTSTPQRRAAGFSMSTTPAPNSWLA